MAVVAAPAPTSGVNAVDAGDGSVAAAATAGRGGGAGENRTPIHQPVNEPEQVSFFVLVPAFMTSELKTAFQMGFMLFIPFLVIDMVVASVLMSMGMMMLSPLIVSLPFKLMLFVLVDGWVLVMGALTTSFAP